MNNREWLATLSNDDFAKWCCTQEEVAFGYEPKEPTPRLDTIKYRYSSSYLGLLKWLSEERWDSNEK